MVGRHPYQLKKIPHKQKVDASDPIGSNRIDVIYPTVELKVLFGQVIANSDQLLGGVGLSHVTVKLCE